MKIESELEAKYTEKVSSTEIAAKLSKVRSTGSTGSIYLSVNIEPRTRIRNRGRKREPAKNTSLAGEGQFIPR